MTEEVDPVVQAGLKFAVEKLKLTLVKFLGKGSFGTVFLALDDKKRKHAVKVCPKPTDGSYDQLEVYFQREIDIQKEIRHPNVVMLYFGGLFDKYSLLDMEYCDTNLEDYVFPKLPNGVRSYVPLKFEEFRNIAKQLTCGIYALHCVQVVHRDIKPENIMIVKSGGFNTYKFGDLGLAKKEYDRMKTVLGSPLYEAPEVFMAEVLGEYNNRCDMWSMGIMYYHILTNRFPFPCNSKAAITRAIVNPKTPVFALPQSLNVSECCKHFVKTHLFKNPKDRTSAKEAIYHPFVMPAVHPISMMDVVKSEEFTKCLMYDAELGELAFHRASLKLKEKLWEPHALSTLQEKDPVILVWSDVANAINIRDPAVLEDMVAFCEGGTCCRKDDRIEMKVGEDSFAVFVSLKNGVRAEKAMPKYDRLFNMDKFKALESAQMNDVKKLEAYFNVLSEFNSSCNYLSVQYRYISQNLKDLELIRSRTLNPNALHEKSRSLLQEVRKNCPSFPNIGFSKPASKPYQQLNSVFDGASEVSVIVNEMQDIHNAAKQKMAASNLTFGEELDRVKALFEKHKGLEETCKKQLEGACDVINVVMQAFQADVEVMLNLVRLIQVLEKAKNASDPTVVFPELLPLVKCDYLLVSDSDMAKISGEEKKAPVTVKKSKDGVYVDDIKKQLEALRANCEALKKERDRLLEENKTIVSSAKKKADDYNKKIVKLRSQLKEHGIPDPTV